MRLLEGRRILITGVITPQSIAYAVARQAQEAGASIVLTAHGRPSLVRRVSRRLPREVPVIELDVTDQGHLESLADRVSQHVDGLDGVLHSIAYAPASCFGDDFLAAPWADVATALQVSTHSLASLTRAVDRMLAKGASVVGLDFDASRVWPGYGWMGVAKAGLEATARTLAVAYGPRGVRVNLVAAGPLRTLAASAIGGDDDAELDWATRAPLGWDPNDARPVADACVALLSPLFSRTTGTVVHVDGGYHAVNGSAAGAAAGGPASADAGRTS